MASMKDAIQHGADMVEFDVQVRISLILTQCDWIMTI